MKKKGDIKSFKNSWNKRPEAFYNHWVKNEPNNQIQLAFRMHWSLFNEIIEKEMKTQTRLDVLEVGCGRGSLSSYFSDNGHNCSLLDISEKAIEIAKSVFESNNHSGSFYHGDAENLEFKNNTFDVVFSIGLLEHFTNPQKTMEEQLRVLKKGGIWFGYIVPKYTDNIQKDYNWINELLKGYSNQESEITAKEHIFRSDNDSSYYIDILKNLNLSKLDSFGTYPLPMISHSIEFPFSLMPKESEISLVKKFKSDLKRRQQKTGKHPWICEEGYGNAFLIWAQK